MEMKSSPLSAPYGDARTSNGYNKEGGVAESDLHRNSGHSPPERAGSRSRTESHARPHAEDPDAAQEFYDLDFEALIEQILLRIGEDPSRDGLVRTPMRVAKALDELTSGYQTDLDAIVNDAIFEHDGQEMVLVKDIEFYSLCEHHMLPFYGKVHIAYIPNGKIVGLSKVARVADAFARRLQVQERLTNQIADAFELLLAPKGVAVMAEASHFCMMMRGVQKQSSSTVTSAMRGLFKDDPDRRRDFLHLVRRD